MHTPTQQHTRTLRTFCIFAVPRGRYTPSPDLAWKAVALLLEFHHIFSLEPNEIGCTDTMEHVIKLMKDELFKERFWCIAPPLVDEVHQHIQEMLDSGAI